tara:strand:+ start:642 stop:926 length:285 start_codon:yes stop_codon:yes gene_type:complete
MTDHRSPMRRFLGGSPGHVLLKLVVLSFVVGLVFAAVGFTPADIVFYLTDWVRYLPMIGWDAVMRVGQYLLLGAMIVVPIWLIVRVLESVRSRG